MARKLDLEAACNVYWGEFSEEPIPNIASTDNFEEQIIMDDLLSKLSAEAKMVIKVILRLPDEMFTATGRIINKKFIRFMKFRYNWSAEKTMIAREEIKEIFS